MKIAVSACLAGKKVRYDGQDKRNEKLLSILKDQELILICPEIMAGGQIPREPIERKGNRIIDRQGKDKTEEMLQGCGLCLEKISGCQAVILKSKSPTCGIGMIYDGTFSGRLIEGNGLFAQLCIDKGIPVFDETMLMELQTFLKR